MRRARYTPANERAREREREIAEHGYRNAGRPEPGFFALRLVKGGVEVAARITYGPTRDPDTGDALDRSHYYAAEIDGQPDPSPAPSPSDRVFRVWHYGRRIAESEFRYLTERGRWAREHAPAAPEANPRARVDLATLELPF